MRCHLVVFVALVITNYKVAVPILTNRAKRAGAWSGQSGHLDRGTGWWNGKVSAMAYKWGQTGWLDGEVLTIHLGETNRY